MILLLILGLFIPSSDAHFVNSPETHLAESLKVKCDALPYRSTNVDYGCYFAVMKKIEYRKAAAQCSSILSGAKVATTVRSSVFEAMMIEKSQFHDDSESSDAKYIICVYEDAYKCEAGSSMLTSGRCVERAGKKMNYVDAEKHCASLGMTISAPTNEVDNRIIREALVKDPAWVQKSALAQNGFKWKQLNGFTKWTTCDRSDENPRLYAGSKNALWKCASDTASVIDKIGYWSNTGTKNLMEVVCMKSANNAFTMNYTSGFACHSKSPLDPCKPYHDESGEKTENLPQPLPVPSTRQTCYTLYKTSNRYEVIGRGAVETQRGCEVRCDAKTECSGFSFKDAGFSSSCVLLSTRLPDQKCSIRDTIFQKQTTGCVARTSLTAEFGVDPCIDEIVPSAFRGFNLYGICHRPSPSETDPSKSREYIIRAIDSEGRRFTLDNELGNWLIPSGDMWEVYYDWPGYYSYRKKIVALVCATAGSEKCPCEPLKHPTDIAKPNYPANPDTVPVCQTPNLYYVPTKCETCRPLLYGIITDRELYKSDRAIVKCKAGMWVIYRADDNNGWGVTGISCN